MKGPESALACGQCHSVWAFNGDGRTRSIGTGTAGSFVPGKEDLVQRFVVQPNEQDHPTQKDFIRQTEPDFFRNRFWGDGMIRVTGREMNGVQASPCFKGGEFSCISCHEMHPTTTTQVALKTWAQERSAGAEDGIRLRPACNVTRRWLRASRVTRITTPIPPAAAVTTATCRTPPSACSTPCAATRSPRLTCAKASTTGGPTPAIFVISIKRSVGRRTSLHAWYQQPVPELSEDDKTISAAVQWLVKGDAGQRALLAWGMGWETGAENFRTRLALSVFDLQPARSLCRGPFRCLEIAANPARILGFPFHLHRGRSERWARR